MRLSTIRLARTWREFRRYALGVLLAVLMTELIGHTYHRLRHGVLLWQDDSALEIFRVRPYTVFVPDERVVTLVKNCSITGLRTDENGFRLGTGHYSEKRRVVVFLGDSVPFGWAMRAKQSVPAHFARVLWVDDMRDIGVINAAVPSYSLRQAVKRYEYELDGRFPISAVVLQTWDPASQLALRGEAWTPEMNWATRDAELGWLERSGLRHAQHIRYSTLLYYAFRVSYAEDMAFRLSSSDGATRERFRRHVFESLRELRARLAKTDIALYLLPANPSGGLRNDDPPLTAVRWLNQAIRDYAASAPHTHYVDVVQRFDELGRDGMFVDDCCHLSDAGAARQARIIYDAMSANGDL